MLLLASALVLDLLVARLPLGLALPYRIVIPGSPRR
jgi:hypothetical protein